jgi:bifunctional enzyme CysN/CysC
MADAGLIVLVSFISPFRAERRMARELMDEGEFVEVFVDTPFEECARRDTKGLYKRALAGEIKTFTGVDSPYEAPENAEVHLSTEGRSPDEMVELLEDWLARNGLSEGG